MCKKYIIAIIGYFFNILDIGDKSSNQVLEDSEGIEPISKPVIMIDASFKRRKSSHHFDLDYSKELEEVDTLMENKENCLYDKNVIIGTSFKEVNKKRVNKYNMEMQIQYLESHMKVECDYCKKSIIQKQIMYCMMDKRFCSEYCRYRTFPKEIR